MIEELRDLIPEAMLTKSGAVFNSGRLAFGGLAPLYILGLNPGGDPATHQHETVASHTDAVMAKSPAWAAYRDESWNGRPPGTAGMQPRVLHLVHRLGLLPHMVPMSNLVFERTRSAEDLKDRLDELAGACWPFHAAVIARLNVRTILCMGKDAGNWVRRRLGAHELLGEFVEKNDRRWKSTAHVGPAGLAVVTATHPAIASWRHESTDPTPLVRAALAR